MHLILYDIEAAGTISEHWEKKLLKKNTTIYAFDKNKDKNKISIQHLWGIKKIKVNYLIKQK